jgi:hypothetical protein
MKALGTNLDENVETLTELLQSIPASARGRARSAAVLVENAVQALKKDGGRDPAANLGFAFAIMLTAQRLVENQKSGDAPLIQLLS